MDFPDDFSDRTIDLGAINVPVGVDELSLCAWVFQTAQGAADESMVIAKGDGTGASGKDWAIQIEETTNPAKIRFTLDTGAGGNILEGATTLTAGVWNFIVCTYDGVDKKIFLNAVQDATEPQTGNVVTSARAVNLAAIDSTSIKRELDGLLDDVRIYNRGLSLAEIQTMFVTLGGDGIVQNLLHRWRMNELAPGVSATIAGSIIDLTGAFNGTPGASPTYAEGILR